MPDGITQVSDGWGLAAFLGYTALSFISGWMLTRVKKSSDAKDAQAAPVIERVQKAIDLSPAVNALSARVKELTDKVEALELVSELKYPMALNVIRQYRHRYPSCDILVPREVYEDL